MRVACQVAVPDTEFLSAALSSATWSDAYAIERGPGLPDDPGDWLAAMLRRPPLWVVPALAARLLLALICGIRPSRRPRRRTGRESVIAVDEGAFDCQVSLLCQDDLVVVSTVGTARDSRGRLFLGLAGRVHPFVVRAVLVRAAAVLGRARACEVPRTPLLTDALPRIDFADAYAVPVGAGMPADPAAWVDASFHNRPEWASVLLGMRDALVGLLGIERGRPSAFDPLAVDGPEVLLGADAGHLDFRASVLREPGRVVVSTAVLVHNLRGRLYFALVRLVHPVLVWAMLNRAVIGLAPAHTVLGT